MTHMSISFEKARSWIIPQKPALVHVSSDKALSPWKHLERVTNLLSRQRPGIELLLRLAADMPGRYIYKCL
jgi:hypothetical protein